MKPVVVPDYVSFALRSPLLQEQIRSKSTQTAQANIFQGSIRSIMIPIPSMDEQRQIVSACIEKLGSADRIEDAIKLESKRSRRMSESVLRHAFAGKLVSQDPSDEPASTLLERIAGERVAASRNKKKPAIKSPRTKKARA